MPGPDANDPEAPLSRLAPEERAQRAGSFGGIASQYERYRPGPPAAAVGWILPSPVGTVVDLGAGTGALARLLLGHAHEVIAVEPDDRMRSTLVEAVPGVRALKGRGESMPLPDRSVDAVIASSSWHWMDPVASLHEAGRVLTPGGTLAVLWSGPDRDGPFLAAAEAMLLGGTRDGGRQASDAGDGWSSEVTQLFMSEGRRPAPSLDIPDGVPFDQPDHEVFTWDVALNADDMIGLVGTMSWIITMSEDKRARVLGDIRRLLREILGLEGDATVDMGFRADVWRARRHD